MAYQKKGEDQDIGHGRRQNPQIIDEHGCEPCSLIQVLLEIQFDDEASLFMHCALCCGHCAEVKKKHAVS